MQFEDFDKKIKEAADNHHPAYDEQAWAKMNKLLDKHMPEKDERRRRFAWLFFLLFLLGGAGIFYGVQSLVGKPEKLTVSESPAESGTTHTDAGTSVEKKVVQVSGTTSSDIPDTKTAETDQPVTSKTSYSLPVAGEPRPFTPKGRMQAAGTALKLQSSDPENKTVNRRGGNHLGSGDAPVFESGSAKKSKKRVVNQISSKAENIISQPLVKTAISENDIENPVIVPGNVVAVPVTTIQAPVTTPVINVHVQPEKDTLARVVEQVTPDAGADKGKRSKRSHFFLTFSAGPDASYTRDGKPGRVIPVTGAGIGYLYKERFSIRAGFYNAAKIYSAAPEAYKAPASFYNYYPFLVNVDANCRVYELPVSLGYHFGARKNHSWFASATISSYLMKRETYNYSYKTSAWGSIQQRKWNLYNDNKHYFSILGFSAGYQRKITDRISFIAEPYLRVPVQGVGYGNVKLNSAGVLFSLAVQPAALLPRKQKK